MSFTNPFRSRYVSHTRCTCPKRLASNTQDEAAEALLDISVTPLLWNYGDDADYRQHPVVNKSWTGTAMHMDAKEFTSGLGLKAPMHLHYNLTQIRTLRPGITHFIIAAGMDDGCDHGGAHTAPYNCHDIAEWQGAVVKIWVDGALMGESPVLQAETLQWVFKISMPPTSTLLRIVAEPVDGRVEAHQQNAYDYVDLVGGFFGAMNTSANRTLSTPPAKSDSVAAFSRCFGGAGHSSADNMARYGHAAGADKSCGTTTAPREVENPAGDGVIKLTTRGNGAPTTLTWEAYETAMILIDLWHFHPCKTITNRFGALVPRVNAATAALRKAGGHVIFAPTDAAESYDGWPQREAVLAQPLLSVPNFTRPIYNYSDHEGLVGVDDECSGGGHGCNWNYGEAFQAPAVQIAATDYIVAGDTDPAEIYSILKRLNVKNVIVGGVAENICVQAKSEGIPTLRQLGFNPILARDLTDAQGSYRPDTYRPEGPWEHPDFATVNVTRWIEQGTQWTSPLSKTVEIAEFIRSIGLFNASEIQEPVLHAPWGTKLRPHIVDLFNTSENGTQYNREATFRDFTKGQPVTLSTWCNAGRKIGCEVPFDIRYTLDGSTPTTLSLNYTAPFLVATTTTVKAAGFTRGGGERIFGESQSFVAVRPRTTCVRSDQNVGGGAAHVCSPGVWGADSHPGAFGTCSCPTNVPSNTALMDLSVAPLLWDYGDDPSYRQHPAVNKSWPGGSLSYRKTSYYSGLGLKAPMHLHYNLTQICKLRPGIVRFIVAAGMDDGCNHGSAHTAPYNCHDIANWQGAVVKIWVDGKLISESPVLQAESLQWVFNVSLPPTSTLLRIVAMPAKGSGPDWMDNIVDTVVQQNSYDYVDLTGGFFGLSSDHTAVAKDDHRLKTEDEILLLKELESHPVARHIARWSSAPTLVPGGGSTAGAQQPDGPIAGNGDFGVSIGGGRECCNGACCAADGGPGGGTEIPKRPGAASLVNADLMLFYGKNDFWYNGPSTISMEHRSPDPRYSSYYYSHGYPGFVLVQIGAASDESDENNDFEGAPACPAGAGPKQPTPTCTANCPVAPSTGGWTKYPHTCPGDPNTCPPGSSICGCSRNQLGHGSCAGATPEACLVAASAACEKDKRCFSFGIACSCNVTNPQPPADYMWETYPIGSGDVVRNPTWTSYTKVAPPPPPPAPPPPPPPPEVEPFAVCMEERCVGRTTDASNATTIVLKSFMGLTGINQVTRKVSLGTMWGYERNAELSEYLWLLVDGQLKNTCTQPACLAVQCLGSSSVSSGDYSMVDCASTEALNISFVQAGNFMRQLHSNGTLVGCISGDRCQRSLATKLKLTPGCNDPAFFEACGHANLVLRMMQYFANSPPKRAMPRFSASQELTVARVRTQAVLALPFQGEL